MLLTYDNVSSISKPENRSDQNFETKKNGN